MERLLAVFGGLIGWVVDCTIALLQRHKGEWE